MIGDFLRQEGVGLCRTRTLFGDPPRRPVLSPRDRSLITVAGAAPNRFTEHLSGHTPPPKQRRLTWGQRPRHRAFYAAGPSAVSAIAPPRTS